MARRMGLPWNYEGPAAVFAEMAALMPSMANITWERLEREGAVTYPVDAADQPGNEIIFSTGFPTETGRARIVPAQLAAAGRVAGCRLPDGAFDRADSGALAYGLNDAARRHPR